WRRRGQGRCPPPRLHPVPREQGDVVPPQGGGGRSGPGTPLARSPLGAWVVRRRTFVRHRAAGRRACAIHPAGAVRGSAAAIVLKDAGRGNPAWLRGDEPGVEAALRGDHLKTHVCVSLGRISEEYRNAQVAWRNSPDWGSTRRPPRS